MTIQAGSKVTSTFTGRHGEVEKIRGQYAQVQWADGTISYKKIEELVLHAEAIAFTAEDLLILIKAKVIVERAAGLDGGTELTACARTLADLADNIAEGLTGE